MSAEFLAAAENVKKCKSKPSGRRVIIILWLKSPFKLLIVKKSSFIKAVHKWKSETIYFIPPNSSWLDDEMLKLYGLYKQATVGDVNTERPGTFSMDFAGKAKWDAWSGNKGVAKEKAEQDYVDVANGVIAKYGLQEWKL